MPKRTGTLTPKERAFVLAYCGAAHGNGSRAAILAGYARGSAAQTSTKLLRKAHIRTGITKLSQVKAERTLMAAEERDKLLAECARDEHAGWKDRRGAIDSLNKLEGRYLSRIAVEGKLTLEQALGFSRSEELDK